MKTSKTEVAVWIGLIVVGFGLLLAGNEWLYGDWRCALAQCRIDK